MFKQAVIHYPADEKARAQIHKDTAEFLCAAAVAYLDSLPLDDAQRLALLDSLLQKETAASQPGKRR